MNSTATLHCLDERRRQQARDRHLNGVDYVEVSESQTELTVHLFSPINTLDNLQAVVEGGTRIRSLQVTNLWHDPNEPLDRFHVAVDRAGDFSIYTLRLVEARDHQATDRPPAGFDPRYAQVRFSFKVGCPSDLDCKADSICVPEKPIEPDINYLAKDYGSFRQLILDRLALIMPDWQERHVPDIGITLVEILAYVGDYLSYYQDAVATEAYLNTARRRISVRRHARLVDYLMHEGCNARAWVCIELTEKDSYEFAAADVWFVAGLGDAPSGARRLYSRDEFSKLSAKNALIYQPLWPAPTITLFQAHNTLKFYTWGDTLCCLPRGATAATLLYQWKPDSTPPVTIKGTQKVSAQHYDDKEHDHSVINPPAPADTVHLKVGDVLIFEEVIGPKTGNPADADPSRRWAVRLTRVTPGIDPLNGSQIVEIEWCAADALPFSFCLSVRLGAPDCRYIGDISVARGNVVLVDHGCPTEETTEEVPTETQTGECACEGSAVDMTAVPGIFEPELKDTPLTFRQPLSTQSCVPASSLLKQNPRGALPDITLYSTPANSGESWLPKIDLLGSTASDRDFVVEMDNEGRAHLRFGDGECGRQPDAGTSFTARYRVGNGRAGNVGADTITSIVLPDTVSGISLRPRNPLAAEGGIDPEPIAEVKLFAPGAFRKILQRAIIADDYARLTEREFPDQVQRAGSALRWTGSWYEVQTGVDPRGKEIAPRDLLKRIDQRLRQYRRMGFDANAVSARLVPLDIVLSVCVLPHFLRGHVEAALRATLGTGRRPDGKPGFFHPDSLTFGDGIFVSKLVAAVQAVPGVESVRVTKLQRYAEDDHGELAAGVLALGPLEVAQVDNDPNFPEHGRLKFILGGGR